MKILLSLKKICFFTFFFNALVVSCNGEHAYSWAVIGAGPAGIAAVGNLLDNGIDGTSIVWIDPAFSVGRLGQFYRNVPSNTQAKYFLEYLQLCKAFDFEQCSIDYPIFHLDPEQGCALGNIVQPLQWVTEQLAKKVHTVQYMAEKITRQNHQWIIHGADRNITVLNLVLATGCHPRRLNYPGVQEIALDIAVDAEKIKNYIKPDDIVAVFGVADSGMLVLKNLSQCQAKKIISFAKHPVQYGCPPDQLYGMRNGLKGVVAQWAREVFESNLPSNFIKCTCAQEEIDRYLPQCTKVIYAVGFERKSIPDLSDEVLDCYDPCTGVLEPHLYGLGIAFPEIVTSNQFEQPESAIGIWDFMVYAQYVVPLWIKLSEEV